MRIPLLTARRLRFSVDAGIPKMNWIGIATLRYGEFRSSWWWLVVVNLLAVFAGGAIGHEVYLRELTIHDSIGRPVGTELEVYLSCEYDNRGNVTLDQVKATDTAYRWGEEQMSVTDVDSGNCRMCSVKESNRPVPEDEYWMISICARDFEPPDGLHTYAVDTEFEAKFQCRGCVSSVSEPQARVLLFNSTEDVDGTKAGEDMILHSPAAVGAMLRSSNQSANSTVNSTSSFTESQSGSTHASYSEEDHVTESEGRLVRVRSTESHSSGNGISLTASTSVTSVARPSSTGGKDKKSNSLALAAAGLFVVALVAGLVGGMLLYRSHRARKQRREEEKMKELEAILGDPNMDFDQLEEQDNKAMGWNLNLMRNFGPKSWNRIPNDRDLPEGTMPPKTKL